MTQQCHSGHMPEKTQHTKPTRHGHPYVHCSCIHHRWEAEATQVPVNRQVDKAQVACVYNGISHSLKTRTNSQRLWKHGWPRGHYAKWIKSDREKQMSQDSFSVKLKNKISEQTKQKCINRYGEQSEGWQRRRQLGALGEKVERLRSTNWPWLV